MKKNTFLLQLVVVSLLLSLNSCFPDWLFEDETGVETATSTDFYNDTDGWMIEGDASTSTPTYSDSTGVDHSGCIWAKDDVVGGVWYFVAPSKYIEKLGRYYDGYMRFYLIQKSAMNNQFNEKDIVIDAGEHGRIIYYFDSFPGLTWTFYNVNIHEDADWYDEDGFIANRSKIQDVLEHAEKLSIRGEYQSGADEGGLDSFSLVE